MAHDGGIPAFRDVAANATAETTAAQKGSASVSQVAPGSPVPAGRGEKSEDANLLLRFFDLKRNPFSATPEEGFFYSSAAVRQIYRELITTLSERAGGAVLTGEAGVGKSMLLRRLRGELRAAGHLVIARYRAGLCFNELVTVIAEELQVPSGNDDEIGFPTRLREQLERTKCVRPPVLVIDDAERLGGDVIRNLARLLVGPADRSLRVLLGGRPELAKRLELPVLAELRRTLLISSRLERLDDDEAASYIFHRLRAAGYRGSDLFLPAAINTVVAKAGGLPGQINRLCAKSLTLAAATGMRSVTSEIVEQAARELGPKDAAPDEAEHERAPARRAAIAASMGASIVAAGIVLCALMGREQASELVGTVSALHRQAPSREEAAAVRQVVAIPPEGDGVLPERRPGNTELIRLRLEEAPQLKQAVQVAFDESGAWPAESLPRPAAIEPVSPNLRQAADPCPWGVCSESPDSADHGNTVDGGPIMSENERPGENRGEANSVAGTEPMAQAEQRPPVQALISRAQSQLEAGHIADPVGDNAVETYRQLFAMGPKAVQEGELLEQIRLALWASARNALRAGKLEEAWRFYELAVHPAVDIEDAEPLATAPTHDIDTEVAAVPEPVLSHDSAQGARAPDSSDRTAPSAPQEIGKTQSLDQPNPGQALEGKEAVVGEPSSAAVPQASDDVAAVPVTGTTEPAQAVDSGGAVGASTMPKMSNDGSLVAAGSAQQSEGVGNSGTPTLPEAGPPNAVAPATVPAVMMPAASPIAAEIIAALIKRGDELFRTGDISSARLAYERAANGGSARAMTALGMTYDPSVLSRIHARGIQPDPAMAAEWYRRAAALGDVVAAARISQLPALAK
jgi:type II secretory pathway predicted ATPase ExeA